MISSDLNYATHLAKNQACYFFINLGLDLYWYDPHAHLLIKWLISNPVIDDSNDFGTVLPSIHTL